MLSWEKSSHLHLGVWELPLEFRHSSRILITINSSLRLHAALSLRLRTVQLTKSSNYFLLCWSNLGYFIVIWENIWNVSLLKDLIFHFLGGVCYSIMVWHVEIKYIYLLKWVPCSECSTQSQVRVGFQHWALSPPSPSHLLSAHNPLSSPPHSS